MSSVKWVKIKGKNRVIKQRNPIVDQLIVSVLSKVSYLSGKIPSNPIVLFIDSNLRERSHKIPFFLLLATAVFLPVLWKRALALEKVVSTSQKPQQLWTFSSWIQLASYVLETKEHASSRKTIYNFVLFHSLIYQTHNLQSFPISCCLL